MKSFLIIVASLILVVALVIHRFKMTRLPPKAQLLIDLWKRVLADERRP